MRRSLLTVVAAGGLALATSDAGLGQAPVQAPAPPPAQRAPATPRPATPDRPAAPAPQAAPAQKPYRPVAVTLPAIPRDPAFDALRKELADIARRKDRSALAHRVVARDFFWERDFSGSFDPRRSSIDNLAEALGLEADDGSGWDALAAFVAETSAGPLPGRPAIICAPAIAEFDEQARDQLLESTQSDGQEWNYPRQAGLQVRGAPQANAPVVETLGLYFVRVVGFDEKGGDTDPVRNSWARVATPSGKTGFAPPNSLVSPYADRLCYGKEGAAWRIVGYVGGGD